MVVRKRRYELRLLHDSGQVLVVEDEAKMPSLQERRFRIQKHAARFGWGVEGRDWVVDDQCVGISAVHHERLVWTMV